MHDANNDQFFREILKNNYSRVFRLCVRYFSNTHDAEDATQEVFIKVWSNIKKFRGESSISTWIYRIATNVCLTSLRQIKNVNLTHEKIEEKVLYVEHTDETSTLDIEEAKVKFIVDYQQQLTAEDRSLMALYLEDIDSKTISEITGLSDSNIRTRIHRIKKNIKREWGNRYGIR